MAYNNISFDIKDEIALVKINRPKALNALNSETLEELKNLSDELEKRTDVKIIILTGEGDKAFVAGADILEMKDMDPTTGMEFSKKGHQVLSKLENMPKPVIAAVNGYALGGGLELALACDIIYASDKARLGFPEVTLGIHPGFGGTQRLARLVGLARAKELIFTGRVVTAKEAFEMGLVNKVVPHDDLMKEVFSLAETIKSCGPIAVRLAKECVNKSLYLSLEEGLFLEATNFGICFGTKDQKEGMTAFVEKRKPLFKGE
ncbi:MAG: enoyl-CoA hydratase-related protein [Desulfobacterota bacterium]|nr:enoyl-CoA hydratase-related protein [Thermodesulfobacteriota bacterium]MDW8001794.1 enoyl-CoA hydratase-related protein [Deltaproteobacteria bacterium]